jgi:cytochrome c biogenesis protein CcmG/thiol:disulfide interchange protein DsbE
MSEQAPRRIAPIISVAIAAVMIFFIVILAISSNNKTENAATPLLLKPAPEITSTTYDGDVFLLSRRRGSWVVLNFFNSTCVPCKREHPELVKFFETQQSLNGTGAELYTIVNDDDEQAGPSSVTKMPIFLWIMELRKFQRHGSSVQPELSRSDSLGR